MKLVLILFSFFFTLGVVRASEENDLTAFERNIHEMNSSGHSCATAAPASQNKAVANSKSKRLELDVELLGSYKNSGRPPCQAPYTMVFKKDGQTLLFLAVSHLAGPESLDSEKLKRLRDSVEKFQPDNLIVEMDTGGQDFQKKRLTKRFSDCIAAKHFTCGESIYSAKIAQDIGANVRGGEPDDSITNEFLLKTFKKEELLGYRSIQTILTMSRSGLPSEKWSAEFQKYSEHDPLINSSNWSYEDFTRWLKKNMNSAPSDVNSDWLRPDSKSALISQRISSGEDPAREPYIVHQIEAAMNRGSKTMVIYGSGHAMIQRPVYEKFFGAPKIECLK